MNFFARLLPSSLTNRVFGLYAITLLVFVGGGLGLFLKTQFQRQVDEKELASVMLIEVVAQSVQDSVVVGDFDAMQKILNKGVLGSQFSSASFIATGGGMLHAENKTRAGQGAPAWLVRWVQDSLDDVNRTVTVGGRDYGVLRLEFDAPAVAAELWTLTLFALGGGLTSLIFGLALIRFALGRWLGGLVRLREMVETLGTDAANTATLIIDHAPIEIHADPHETLRHVVAECGRPGARVGGEALDALQVREHAEHRRSRAAHAGDAGAEHLERAAQLVQQLVAQKDIGFEVVHCQLLHHRPAQGRGEQREIGRVREAAAACGVPAEGTFAAHAEVGKEQPYITRGERRQRDQSLATSRTEREGVCAREIRHVGAKAEGDPGERLFGHRYGRECIERAQHCGGVGAAAAQSAAHRDVLRDLDGESLQPRRGVGVGDGGAPGEVLLDRSHLRAGAIEGAPRAADAHGHVVGERDALEERVQLVVAAGLATDDAEPEVELGLRGDARRTHGHACGAEPAPLKSRKWSLRRVRYSAPITVMGM